MLRLRAFGARLPSRPSCCVRTAAVVARRRFTVPSRPSLGPQRIPISGGVCKFRALRQPLPTTFHDAQHIQVRSLHCRSLRAWPCLARAMVCGRAAVTGLGLLVCCLRLLKSGLSSSENLAKSGTVGLGRLHGLIHTSSADLARRCTMITKSRVSCAATTHPFMCIP